MKFARTTWPEPEEDPHPWPLIRESETEALEILCRLAPRLATSATRRVGTVSIEGNDAAIEPAAPGTTLSAHLASHHMATLPSVAHRVVEWATEVGIATYDPEITAPDLDHWLGARRSVQAVEPIGTCVAHGDLSTLNIITDLSGFAIIDWETARPVGFPLLDVVTVCTDILVHRFGPLPKRERVDWVCSLWADELPQSAQCFTWLESAAASMGLSAEQASALVIAAWAYCLDEPDSGYRGSVHPEWMQHPKLGPMWSVESAASWQKANR
ncbi:MAG: phosphotransferase [Actinomycetia bacterium]|nr:phosphotransferase [Actinomycetes bacterium]